MNMKILGLAAAFVLVVAGFGLAHAQTYGTTGNGTTGNAANSANTVNGTTGTNSSTNSGTLNGTTNNSGTVNGSGTNGTTPGVPNTGVGGNAPMNALLLSASALLMVLGSAYVLRTVRE